MKYRARLVAFVVIIGVAGCATQKQEEEEPVLVPPTPVCSSDLQCQAMWVEAQKAVSEISGMRIEMATDSLIETFRPVDSFGRMQGTVYKAPNPDGSFNIEASFFCQPYYCNSRLEKSGLALFNSRVTSKGRMFETVKKFHETNKALDKGESSNPLNKLDKTDNK